ncbi:MAG: hypothetical protein RSC41_01580 [Oscillospiraceae bacterium]
MLFENKATIICGFVFFSLTLKALLYITDLKIKSGNQVLQPANSNTSVGSQLDSISTNTNIQQDKNNFNNSISKKSKNSVNVLDKMLKNQ